VTFRQSNEIPKLFAMRSNSRPALLFRNKRTGDPGRSEATCATGG